jgi:hypothetical protein
LELKLEIEGAIDDVQRNHHNQRQDSTRWIPSVRAIIALPTKTAFQTDLISICVYARAA